MEIKPDEIQWNERKQAAEQFFRKLQKDIVEQLEVLNGTDQAFDADVWNREEGGGGRTCVLQDGKVFEKVGIGFSRVEGEALPASASARREGIGGQAFTAMGVSLVAHPRSPMVPTAHMNVRLFVTTSSTTGKPVWWFGGGYDLTPYYPYAEDCIHWHQVARDVCLKHYSENFYQHLKKWCDDYFYIKHRQCARGIGGVFFDDLCEPEFDSVFAFVKDIGHSFMQAYSPIVEKRKNDPYTDKERQFQLYRRGRYVEFNLVYDRGTLFGLQSGGRVESILMSMPPLVRFDYGWKDDVGSREEKLESQFLKPQDWANLTPNLF